MSKIVIRPRNDTDNSFPSFVLDPTGGEPDFVALIASKIKAVDFNDARICDDRHRDFYRTVKAEGAERAVHKRMPKEGLTGAFQATLEALVRHLGCYLIGRLTPEEKTRCLPQNDVVIRPSGVDIEVTFSCLEKVVKPNGWEFFHSRRKPTVTFGHRSFVVGFSKHVLDQICGCRLVPNYRNYMGMGEAHSYFADCVYFEPTTVRPDGKNASNGFTQQAIGLFQNCCLNNWHPEVKYKQIDLCLAIVKGALNLDYLTQPCYLRVGYCPVAVLDEYAVARTFLRVGFQKTREYAIIEASSLSRKTRSRFQRLATKEGRPDVSNRDEIALLRWLHRNGAPQVISLKQEVFAGEAVGGILDSPYAKTIGLTGQLESMASQVLESRFPRT